MPSRDRIRRRTPLSGLVVAAVVERGEHKDAAAVIDFALRRMEHEQREHATKVEAFSEAVGAGLDDLDNGRYAAVAIEDLPDFVAGLSPRLERGASSE